MIYGIRANKPSFREVRFEPGFNVVLADITKESTKKDSRNGLGKSTLIEIIHFCFGAQATKGKGLCSPPLVGWEFTVEFDLGSRLVQATRSVSESKHIMVSGDEEGLGIVKEGVATFAVNAWREVLGEHLFGLSPREEMGKWSPTFRALFAYIVRRGKSAFLSPFSNDRNQQTWDQQVSNAYLMGLAWEDAQSLQHLREKEKAVKALKDAARAGVLDGMLGDMGKLEADRVRMSEEVEQSAARLASFRVHDDYAQIEKRASALTTEIHALSNRNVVETRRLEQLRTAIRDETASVQADEVVRLYQAAGVELPGMVVQRLAAVQTFHSQVVSNRREFLTEQVGAVENAIVERTRSIRELSDERAGLMTVLRETGALEEHTALQQRHLALSASLKTIEAAVANLKKFEVGQSTIKVEKEQLHQRALRDYEERAASRERAIRLFNAHSQALYAAPGRLLVNVSASGFKFDVQIERADSDGVSAMQVFCYDLTIAELWAAKDPTPGFLIHDSLVFDGVDPRQRGLGLAEAAVGSDRAGFQYICTLNSDAVPYEELPAGFDLDQHVRLRLTDATPEGSLLGIRF